MKRFALAAVAALSISVPAVSQAAVLYDNGLVVPTPGGVSLLTSPASTFGFGSSTAAGTAVADSFSVVGTSWNVESLDFYSYQTGAVGFTFLQATWSIISGDVNTGSVVASGVTNVTNGGLMGYRALSTTPTNTDRAIYRLSTDIPDLVLATGNYFLRWSLTGSAASGPWTPPIIGSPGAGNAAQLTSTSGGLYNTLVEVGSGLNVELPFTINGTRAVTPGAVPEPATWLMMFAGFALVGAGMRRRQANVLKLV
jgi:PEP-CTERM motif